MEEYSESQTSPEEPSPSASKRYGLWASLAALLVVITAASFVGGQFINGRTGKNTGEGSGPSLTRGGPGIHESVSVKKMSIIPAPELPVTGPAVNGLYTRRIDNSLFLGTGKLTFKGTRSDSGPVSLDPEYGGSEVEVVVTNKTQIYRNGTEIDPESTDEDEPVEQKVTAGSLDEIGQNSIVQVWGHKVGDRTIASVLLYTLPPVRNAPLKNK